MPLFAEQNLTELLPAPRVSAAKRKQFATRRRLAVKSFLLAAVAGIAVLSTMAPAPVEARTTERATMNRLDPNRITDKRVQRRDYAGRRYSWRDGDDYRYRRYNGWTRYSHRPYGWRDRGCASIGPIWFCS